MPENHKKGLSLWILGRLGVKSQEVKAKEDLLQYKKYFLYDKLLTDWLAVNESGFSINDLGNVEFIEVLPLEVNE